MKEYNFCNEKNEMVSIIIPVWNKLDLTKQCLLSIQDNTNYSEYEIIIIDNNSTDGTSEFLKLLGGEVKITTNEKNLGFAIACNQGAKIARGKYLLFLNNDTIVTPNWLTYMIQTIKDENVGIVGAKLLYKDDSIQHCGVSMRRDRQFFKHPYKFVEKSHPLVSYQREWDAVTGACLLTKKSIFEEVEGFDENFLNGCEDIDYCCKVRLLNYKIIYQPQCEVYHLESQTPRMENADDKNFSYFVKKWGRYSIKTELDIFVEDKMWAYSGGRYFHQQNQFVKEWMEKFNKAEQSFNKREIFRIQKLIKHLYTVEEWYEKPSIIDRIEKGIDINFEVKTDKSDKQKILFVCHNFPPERYGGAQLYALNLAKEMKRLGICDVEVLYPVFRGKIDKYFIEKSTFEGVVVHRLYKDFARGFEEAVKSTIAEKLFTEFLDNNHFDAIHFHGFGQLTPVPIEIAKKKNIKTVMTLHEHWFLCFFFFLTTPDQNRCSGPESVEKCTNCFLKYYKSAPKEKMTYSNVYDFMKNRFSYFKYCFDLVDYKFSPSNFLAEKFNDFSFDNITVRNLGMMPTKILPKKEHHNLVIGYIGQVSVRKGVNILIDAVLKLNKPDIEIKIYGKSHEEGFIRIIENFIKKIPNINYYGAYTPEDLPEILSQFDILAVPSLWENYPLVVQEAFQHKVPVIASNVGGFSEVIKHNINGMLFEVENADDLAEKLYDLYIHREKLQLFRENIKPVKEIKEDAFYFSDLYKKNKEIEKASSIPAKASINFSGLKIQFYILRNVHFPMFEELYKYIKKQTNVAEIIFCLGDVQQLIGGYDYSIIDKILSLNETIVGKPRRDVDITFIADSIAGKVYECGKIVNIGHGTISKGYYFTSSVWTDRENWVDLLCVPGDYALNKMQGNLNTKVAPTGMPKLDGIFRNEYNHDEICHELNINPNKKIILYAPTFNIDLSSVYDFAEEMYQIHSDDYYVIFKLHGSTLPNVVMFYQNLAKEYSNFIFANDMNLSKYIAISDVMISDVSSAWMEFMATDKPVILYNNPNRYNYHGLDENNIEWKWRELGIQINSFTELSDAINQALYHDDKSPLRMKYANMLFSDRSGKASENVWQESLKLLSERSKITLPIITIYLNLNRENLFLVRQQLFYFSFYSVLPIEIIINLEDEKTPKIESCLKQFSSYTSYYNFVMKENISFEKAIDISTGDYIVFASENIQFYKNFDYMIYKGIQNNPEVVVFTGVSLEEEGEFNANTYIPYNENISIDRFSFEFINAFANKKMINPKGIFSPQIFVLNKHNYDKKIPLTILLQRELHILPSLFFTVFSSKEMQTIKNVVSSLAKLPLSERENLLKQILDNYFFSDIAEELLYVLIEKKSSFDEILNTLQHAVQNRFYDLHFKEKVIEMNLFPPNLVSIFKKDIALTKLMENKGDSLSSISHKNTKKRIMFYFFKNVHIPILKPIYLELKKMSLDIEIGFGVMQYAPQIRAGFLPHELNLIKELGEDLYFNPQEFHPDITFIADSVYPWVQNCGKLINVGHGVLSKGQYYTDTALARREENADLICVPGEYHKIIMEKIVTKKVVATGMAKMDKLFSNELNRDELLKKYGLPLNAKYILFAPTFNDELSAIPYVKDKICDILEENQFLIIKLHGSTKIDYKQMYANLPFKNSQIIFADDSELDISPFMAIADVMISDVSSAMMEFAALDKPVVLFNNPQRDKYKNYNPNDIEYKWRNIGIEVNNLEEMKTAVSLCLQNPNLKQTERKLYTDWLFANKYTADAAKKILQEALKYLK